MDGMERDFLGSELVFCVCFERMEIFLGEGAVASCYARRFYDGLKV